jgi:protocatechuate 3,4-dioxygenase beta subunit
MARECGITRRQLVQTSLAWAGLATMAPLGPVLAQTQVRQTPGEILGPFYPVIKSVDRGADLTTIPGRPSRAQGQVIHLMGRVLNLRGEPLSGVKVEIWQANTYGRYVHPSDTNPAPLDPNFEGYGVQLADSEGRYRFKTIKPGAYPTGIGDWTRPPHIHFDVMGSVNRLVTQMYFDGDPLNEKDQLLQRIRCKDCLTTKLLPPPKDLEPDSLVAVWDIVLSRG